MNILYEFPPNVAKIREVIDLDRFPRACFTYGRTIYNPSKGHIDEPLGIHEAQHSLQQDAAGGPEAWWNRWLREPKFRAEQELEAYGLQYRRYCELHKDRNERARELQRLAADLSSPQYGSVLSFLDACALIRTFFH
jgi:hypothetical protein